MGGNSKTFGCFICNIQFSFIVRQHKCKNCLKAVCSSCSPLKLPVPSFDATNKPHRVCNICYDKFPHTFVVTPYMTCIQKRAIYKKEINQLQKNKMELIDDIQKLKLDIHDIQKLKLEINDIDKLNRDELCQKLQEDLENYMTDNKYLCKKKKKKYPQLAIFHKNKSQIIRNWTDSLYKNHLKNLW